jgi:HEAT repeat protein
MIERRQVSTREFNAQLGALRPSGYSDEAEYFAALTAALRSPVEWKRETVRGRAAWRLGRTGDEAAVQPLIDILGDPVPRVRFLAVLALGRLQSARAVPYLTELLDDPDLEVVSAATESLGRLKARDAAPRIALGLQSEDPGLRLITARALVELGVAGSEVDGIRSAARRSPRRPLKLLEWWQLKHRAEQQSATVIRHA